MAGKRTTIPNTTKKGTAEVPKRLKALNNREPFASLATSEGGKPYLSLISFAFTPDLKEVIFATPRNTRKFKNIMGTQDVALLIDNRSNKRKGVMEAEAVTVIGKARALRRNVAWIEYAGIFLKKHPELEEFINAKTTALVVIEVTSCVHVGRFQTVTVIDWKAPEG